MNRQRHILRDTFVLTAPLAGLLVYFVLATGAGFYNAEVRNFHGYLTRSTRLGGPARVSRTLIAPTLVPPRRGYMPLRRESAGNARRIDLRVRGRILDALGAGLPGSGQVWQPAIVMEGKIRNKVQVRHRGEAFANFFGTRKTWKIKTGKRSLIDGYRVLNLTPIESDRLPDHLAFLAARTMGLPASRTRVVHLFLNLKDQGLYLQEEQVDESMMRRCDRMPGDVFYGELFIPNEAKLGSNDLFWNPFLWRKKAAHNRYPDEYRPYLTDLLDHVNDRRPESFERLYGLLELDEFALYFGLLSYFGDQHVDRSHNQKLYFNPLSGKFEGLIWNAMITMPEGVGLESVANPLFTKLCRDPRFLTRVHRLMDEKYVRAGIPALMLAEVDRLLGQYGGEALNEPEMRRYFHSVKAALASRIETVRKQLATADAAWASEQGRLRIHARSAAALRLDAVELTGAAEGVRLFEDRDFDGQVGPADRELNVEGVGSTLHVRDAHALVHTGRDFRAPYHEPKQARGDTFVQFRMYTRLAYLTSRYLVVGADARVAGVALARTVGDGAVTVRAGEPQDYVAEETVHPWSLPQPRPPKAHSFRGEVRLEESLVVGENDRLEVEPGTRLLLAPGVSILVRARTDITGVTIERLDPRRPWGVLALQGPAASGSRIVGCTIRGGSEATLEHVYFSGMLSVHYADRVLLKDTVVADNLLGDDTVRFGRCHDLRIERCLVEGANGDAIDCDISTGLILDTRVVRPRNDGIDLMTANVGLQRVSILGAGDKGISFGESANPTVEDCVITACVMGVGIKDSSDPLLERVEIRGCRVAISGYDKNWRYPGGGRGRLVDCTLTGNGRDIVLDPASTLTLERCVVEFDFQPPKDAVDEGRVKVTDLVRKANLDD